MKRDPLPNVLPSAGAHLQTRASWRNALAALAVSLLWVGICFFGTAAAMVGIWSRSETFAHGFVVAPISLWLIWRMRAKLSVLEPEPSWLVLPLLVAAGFAWLLGQVGAVNAVAQFAFVAMLVLTVPAVLGIRVARAMLFPLAFLFFSVPAGEFLMPTLMSHTADFTVLALRATGVPVYREGLQLVIPTGRWSIVEACSGIRYLIASVMVGTLFAYLNYTSLWRRLAFVGVAIAVPIVANWLRAYLIVMLGHLSDNRIATGVDHVIYGWLFFGIVMLVMFAVGARWREPERVSTASGGKPVAGERARVGATRLWGATLGIVAATIAWPLLERALQPGEASATLAAIEVAGWNGRSAETRGFTPHFEGASAVRHEQFLQEGRDVGLYVAYYRGQTTERKLVSSGNVLVPSEDRNWHTVASGGRETTIGGEPVKVVAARIRGSDGQMLAARQWYWIDGTLVASDPIAKALIAWHRVTGRGDDSAVIVVYAPAGSEDATKADQTLDAFTHDAWPAITAALTGAKAGVP